MTKKPRITEEQLTQLYVKEEKSIKEIADHLECGWITVRNYMKKYGIEQRPKPEPKPKKVPLSKMSIEDQINALHAEYTGDENA